MEVTVAALPPRRVAYMRHVGPYGAHGIPGLWTRFIRWMEPRGLLGPESIRLGIGHDDPDVTPPDKCRYDACIVVPDSFEADRWVNVTTVPGESLYRRWLPHSGYEHDDRPCDHRALLDARPADPAALVEAVSGIVLHPLMCVQGRQTCSAGESPAGARARRPVAWMAGRRETEPLKPIDEAIRRMVSEWPGRNGSERTGSLENAYIRRPSVCQAREGNRARRKLADAAASSRIASDSLVVTHPFHPLAGQRLPVLFERRLAGVRLYICEGGSLGTVTLPEDFTDRGLAPAVGPLTAEVLAELASIISTLERKT